MKIKLFLVSLFLLFALPAHAGPIIGLPDGNTTTINSIISGDYGPEVNLPVGDTHGGVFPDTLAIARANHPANRAGLATLFYGSPTGIPTVLNMANANVKITGETYQGIGSVAAAVGRVNDDKLSEFILSRTMNNGIIEAVMVFGNKNFPTQFPLKDAGSTIPAAIFTGFQFNTVASADFNGDGKTDLALGSGINGEFYFVENSQIPANGVLDVNTVTKFIIPGQPFGARVSLAAADTNCDGRKDLIVANISNGKFYRLDFTQITLAPVITLDDAFFASGKGTRVNTYVAVNAVNAYGFKDVTKDGCDDFAVVGVRWPALPQIAIWKGKSGTWPPFIDMPTEFNSTLGFFIDGAGDMTTQNESLQKVTSVNGRLVIGDYMKQSVYLYDPQSDWAFHNTLVNGVQPGVTKYTGQYIGSMVAGGENENGEIGCGTSFTLHIGANPGGLFTGKGFIVKI